jgi:tRNA-dihydrouridine synthase
VDGVAFARGALGNPWIFRQLRDHLAGRPIAKPPVAEQRELLARHYAMCLELYGPRRTPKIMRKFGIKYARVHPAPSRLRAAFVAVSSQSDWLKILEDCYRD